MPLSRKQRKKRLAELETVSGRAKARRRQKQKAKKLEKRLAEEAQMADYLARAGWHQSGPLMDVWSISNWERPGTCYQTLRGAFRIQKKLEAMDYQRPAGIDDDLSSIL